MFGDFGDQAIRHGFWYVQISIMQHWKMDWMMANKSRCVQHLQKLVVFHETCEMRHSTWDKPLSLEARNDIGLKTCMCCKHQVWHRVQWL